MKTPSFRHLLSLSLAIIYLGLGCANLDPNASAIVVRAEQTETTALATFDLILNIDNANRAFYRTNAPEFHAFCEYLRAPMSVHGTNYQRSLAMVLSLQEVKAAYKRSRTNQNALVTSLGTLTAVLDQAGVWMSSVRKPQPAQ